MILEFLAGLADFVSFFINYQYSWYSLLFIASAIIFFYTRDKKLFVVALFLAVSTSLIVQDFLKDPRPCQTGFESRVPCPAEYGLPSVHAVAAIVLLLGALGTSVFAPTFVLFLLLTLSRIWLGVHSFEQVAAGIAFGALMYFVVFEVKNRFEKSDYGFVRGNIPLEHGFSFSEL